MPVALGLRAQRLVPTLRKKANERAGKGADVSTLAWLPPCGGEKGEAASTAPEASPVSSQRPSDPTGVTDRSPSPVPSSCAWWASLLSGRTRW